MEPSFPAKEILQLCQVNKTNAWGDGTRVAIVDFTQPRNPAQCCSEKPRFAVGRGTVVSLPPPLPLGPTDSQAQPCSPFCHSFLFHHSLSYCSSFLQILKHSAFFPGLGRHWALAGNILAAGQDAHCQLLCQRGLSTFCASGNEYGHFAPSTENFSPSRISSKYPSSIPA